MTQLQSREKRLEKTVACKDRREKQRKAGVTFCMVSRGKDWHYTHNVTTIDSSEYSMVLDLDGLQSFMKRSTVHVQVI